MGIGDCSDGCNDGCGEDMRRRSGSAKATCLRTTEPVARQAASDVGGGERRIGLLRRDCGDALGVVTMSTRRETLSQSWTGNVSVDVSREVRCVGRATGHASSDGSVGR